MLIQDGLATSTIRNHLSAIKSLYLERNLQGTLAVFESHSWALTLRALKFANRSAYDEKSAVTLPHLLRLVRACDVDFALWPLKVALLFGYMGYLRVSNMAPNTVSDLDVTRHTTFSDVWATDNGVLLQLKWTKTLQDNSSRVLIPLPELGKSELCPLQAWRDYRSRLVDVQLSPDSPLLLTTSRPQGRPITVPMIRAYLRRASESAGLSNCKYTPHSLRRGGASCSFDLGVPLEHISKQG